MRVEAHKLKILWPKKNAFDEKSLTLQNIMLVPRLSSQNLKEPTYTATTHTESPILENVRVLCWVFSFFFHTRESQSSERLRVAKIKNFSEDTWWMEALLM